MLVDAVLKLGMIGPNSTDVDGLRPHPAEIRAQSVVALWHNPAFMAPNRAPSAARYCKQNIGCAVATGASHFDARRLGAGTSQIAP